MDASNTQYDAMGRNGYPQRRKAIMDIPLSLKNGSDNKSFHFWLNVHSVVDTNKNAFAFCHIIFWVYFIRHFQPGKGMYPFMQNQ